MLSYATSNVLASSMTFVPPVSFSLLVCSCGASKCQCLWRPLSSPWPVGVSRNMPFHSETAPSRSHHSYLTAFSFIVIIFGGWLPPSPIGVIITVTPAVLAVTVTRTGFAKAARRVVIRETSLGPGREDRSLPRRSCIFAKWHAFVISFHDELHHKQVFPLVCLSKQ